MITFPFFCPACLRDADATADPIELLFGGGELTIKCSECETTFRGVVTDEGIETKEAISASE